jgi:hypothetical protein
MYKFRLTGFMNFVTSCLEYNTVFQEFGRIRSYMRGWGPFAAGFVRKRRSLCSEFSEPTVYVSHPPST